MCTVHTLNSVKHVITRYVDTLKCVGQILLIKGAVYAAAGCLLGPLHLRCTTQSL